MRGGVDQPRGVEAYDYAEEDPPEHQRPPAHGQQDEAEHLGLVSMKERAQMINGVCRINSEPGKGTKIEVSIPLGSLAQRSENGR